MGFKLQSREQIPALLDGLGLTHWGAEVGVATGWFSDKILSGSHVQWLFSIDGWVARERWAGEFTPWEDYQHAINRLCPYGLRSIVMKMLSVEAALVFRDSSMDFVYIDAAHLYEPVQADISAWWPKVRSEGLLMGHDYDYSAPGVMQAVDEFVVREELELSVTECDAVDDGHPRRSWLVQKP